MPPGPGTRSRLAWRTSGPGSQANDACRRDILDRLRGDGPLPSRELPDTCVDAVASTGWTNNRNVTQMLDFMVARGEVAVAGRAGSERLWDLAERVYPDDPVVPVEEARRIRDERRLRGAGHRPAADAEMPGRAARRRRGGRAGRRRGRQGPVAGRPGLARRPRPFAGRAALLSPFDRLVHDRKRMVELFEFDYQLEMYKPAAKRRWGYFALPILYGDRLVGKLDATADRKAGVLRVARDPRGRAVHAGDGRRRRAEIEDLARWLELELAYSR